jgi:hypothetical protein
MSRVLEPKSTPLSLPRDGRMGEVEQRLARRRTQVTVEASRRPLRPADGPKVGRSHRAPGRLNASGAAPALTAATPRSETERTARMRAVEQAWKEERARLIAREAEEQLSARAAASRLAEEHQRQAEAKQAADRRLRLAIEQAKRFRAEARAEAR